jgi:hypothetical protein
MSNSMCYIISVITTLSKLFRNNPKVGSSFLRMPFGYVSKLLTMIGGLNMGNSITFQAYTVVTI